MFLTKKSLASHGALQPGPQGFLSETPRPVEMGLILIVFLTQLT